MNEGPRLQWKQKDKNETKHNYRNAREGPHTRTAWWFIYRHHLQNNHKTPGGYNFTPLIMANQLLWRANQHEHACFGLSSPWSFPSPPSVGHNTEVILSLQSMTPLIKRFDIFSRWLENAQKKRSTFKLLHPEVQPWLPLQRSISPWNATVRWMWETIKKSLDAFRFFFRCVQVFLKLGEPV